MCVILPCADPTAPGVYWRENDRWQKYPDALAKKVLAAKHAHGLLTTSSSPHKGGGYSPVLQLGALASAVHPSGDAYSLDVGTMKQRNTFTQYERDVKIVEEKVPAVGVVKTAKIQDLRVWRAPIQETGPPTAFPRQWQECPRAESQRIIEAFVGGRSEVTLTAQDGAQCVLNMTTMNATHHPYPNPRSTANGGGKKRKTADIDSSKELLEVPCVICCGSKITSPHMLPCGHVFCGACIQKWTTPATASAAHTCPYRCHESQHAPPVAVPMFRTGSVLCDANNTGHKAGDATNKPTTTMYELGITFTAHATR